MDRGTMQRAIVIGGLGRSGTSCLMRAFVDSPSCISFAGLEAKFFTETRGLIDLYRALVTDYSIERAEAAVRGFSNLMKELALGALGQESILSALGGDEANYNAVISRFIDGIRRKGIIAPLSDEGFSTAARQFVDELIALRLPANRDASHFAEKTPHSSLNPWIYGKVFGDVRYIWIVRDLQAVAYSVYREPWGPQSLEASCEWTSIVFNRFLKSFNTVSCLCLTLENLVTKPAETLSVLEEYSGAKIVTPPEFYSMSYAYRWRNEVSIQESDQLQRLLAPDLDKYHEFVAGTSRMRQSGTVSIENGRL